MYIGWLWYFWGAFSDYSQYDRSADCGASGVGCEECKFLIQMNIWIYFYQIWTNIRTYLYQRNDGNEYRNIFIYDMTKYSYIFVSIKLYRYDMNEYLYWKIFHYTNIFITNFWYYLSDLDLVNSVILKTWWFWQTWCIWWIWWFLKVFQFSF